MKKEKKEIEEPKDYIENALRVQKQKLFKIRFLNELLMCISRICTSEFRYDMRIGLGGQGDNDFSRAVETLNRYLDSGENTVYRQLIAFVDIKPEVNEMLKKETWDWFKREDTAIMQYLGINSGYYDHEEKAFRKQMLDALKKEIR
jgi:hypothetical protein